MSDWKETLLIPQGFKKQEITTLTRVAFVEVKPADGFLLFKDTDKETEALAIVRSNKTIVKLLKPEMAGSPNNINANQAHNTAVNVCVYNFINLNNEFEAV